MNIEIFAGEGDFYIRLLGSPGVVRWFREEESWGQVKAPLPDGARKVAFGELPNELREEVLAFVARAEAMGNQIWSSQN